MDKRLAVRCAMDFQFRKDIAFEPFDQDQVDGRHLGHQAAQIPFGLLAQLMQDGPALGR
jgi:hypothetical protein